MTGGGWKFAAASVIGTSHLKSEGSACQDAFSCAYHEAANAFIAVVADGAGSARHSDEGSHTACGYVLERLLSAAPELLSTHSLALRILADLKDRIDEMAAFKRALAKEFACTLLVAIIFESFAVFWQIGDGAICFRLLGERDFKFAFWPEKGDYANVTSFVTDSNAADQLAFDNLDAEVREVALFSDGLERLALDFAKGEPHSQFFNGLFPHVYSQPGGWSEDLSDSLALFLGSDRMNARTDDDKTLILAAR